MKSSSTRPLQSWSVFLVFLRLGLTSFGGPVAHIAYFRDEFVTRRQWLSETNFADIVALCQFLPGPASSQVGMVLGLSRSGYFGAVAAWTGFTMPSAIILMIFASCLARFGDSLPQGILYGLKVAAVAIVAQAIWGMSRSFCRNPHQIAFMLFSTISVLLIPSLYTPIGILFIAAILGRLTLKSESISKREALPFSGNRYLSIIALLMFAALLVGLPILAVTQPDGIMAMVDTFYRAGSLVFGGGHVVLPLLHAEVVPKGWVEHDVFIAGYGAAQAVPGPLFTFAAFLGSSMGYQIGASIGGVIALFAVFAPSFLLVAGVLPFWDALRHNTAVQSSLAGINAAVVGLLLAALYDPLWTSTTRQAQDFGLVLLALAALVLLKLPSWLVVIGSMTTALLLDLVIIKTY